MRCLRWFIASSAVAVVALSVGCIAMQEFPSPPAGEGEAVRTTADSAVDTWPMRDFVLDDAESLIVKIRPAAWPSLRDGLHHAGATAPGNLPEWFAMLTGQSASIDGVDEDRASYLMVESPAYAPWMACLDAGLPCPLLGSPPPLWGRLLVPAESGRLQALESSVRRVLGPAQGHRIVAHETYVRVEFAIGEGALDARQREALGRRAEYDPDPRGVRTTPAKRAFLDHPGALVLYGGLEQMRTMERYVESVLWHHSVTDSPPDQRWSMALQVDRGSYGVGATADNVAWFEDATVAIGGADGEEGIRIDTLATRTRRGREALSEGRRTTIPAGAVTSLIETLEEMTSGLSYRIAAEVNDLIDSVSRQTSVRRASTVEKAWQGLRLELGDAVASRVAPIDRPSEPITFRQPSKNCLAEGAVVVKQPLARGLQGPQDVVEMANAMTAVSGRFERRMTECSGADIMEQERIARAVAAFDLWRGLLVWRVGNREWSRQLVARSCDSGLTWACDVDRSAWPWVDAEPQAAALEAR